MLVVADTTPIITLLKIGRLDLLQIIYKEITIPSAVYAELTENPLFEKEAVEVKNCSFINVSPVQDSEKVNFIQATSGLDLGESESLVLCKELNADLLLMDEARGRLIAKQLGIPLTGQYTSSHHKHAEFSHSIEVKAEENLKAKSLKTVLDGNDSISGVRFSMADYRERGRIVNVPLGFAEEYFKTL